jgi:hypothetical protein
MAKVAKNERTPKKQPPLCSSQVFPDLKVSKMKLRASRVNKVY